VINLEKSATALPANSAQLGPIQESTHSRTTRLAALLLSLVAFHGLLGMACHHLRYMRLEVISRSAATVGAQLLPTDPSQAVRVARAYVSVIGASDHLVASVVVASDSRSITVQISDRLPLYYALTTESFESRDIVVKARAKCANGAAQRWI
jgi:hypothetical protein